MEAFKQMLGELVASKKFNVTLAGVLLTVAAKYGFQLDPELAALIIAALVAVFVGSQGIADHKKEAEKIAAVSAASLSDPSTPKADKAVGKLADSVSAKE